MKKSFLILSIVPLLLLTSCESDEAKAKKIYNNSSLTNEQKIDKLYALYRSSYNSHSDYNKAAGDRAWDAIVDGDYDKAYNITQTYKDTEYNWYAIYYASLLQQPMPRPNKVEAVADVTSHTFTTKDGEVKTTKFSYLKLQFDGPNIKSNCSSSPIVYYKGDFEAKRANGSYIWSFSFNTGDSANKSTNFNLNASALDGEKDLYFTLSLTPYEGWAFSYYDSKQIYKYSIYVNVDTLEAGTYTLQNL